jgi:hypothetical protein
MEKQIGVICKHEAILQTIVRLINQNEQWSAKGISSIDELTSLMKKLKIDLLLLGSGFTAEEEELVANFSQLNDIKLIKHYGGGSGLLYAEIFQAFKV